MRRQTNPFVGLVRLLVEIAKSLWTRTATTNELAACGAAEVARIAHDLGISAVDLYSLASRDKTAADLLNRRLASLQLDPTSVDPAVMRDLQRCCSNCDNKILCAHELEDKPREATWPKYCPNEQTIAAITAKPALGKDS